MNIEKLLKLESEFLGKYPEGFQTLNLKKVSKKHNVDKHTTYLNDVLTEERLNQGELAYKDVAKVVLSSSLISVFEKMRFRDMSSELTVTEKKNFVKGVQELLFGHEKSGFYMVYTILKKHKLAKWPVITIFRAYKNPKKDVFMKPTVVKKVISHLELDMKYAPDPSYTLYRKYRTAINKMKKEVSLSVRPNNLAFTGFLMLSI